MYVRHLAWLHATPEGSKKSRLAHFKQVDEDHPFLELPDIQNEHAAGYVIGLLHEAGLMSSNGMGPVPLSWLELESWMRCTGQELPLWERLVVKTLSEEYVSELVQAKDKNRPAPFTPAPEEIDRKEVSNRIFSILSKRMKGRKPETQEGNDT